MKITKESWLKATADAMSTESAKKLFESDSLIEELFTDYSYHLYVKLEGKTLAESEYNEIVAHIHTELGVNMLNISVNLALMVFAVMIWENLTDQSAQDELNSEYENFKSVLKSQKSE